MKKYRKILFYKNKIDLIVEQMKENLKQFEKETKEENEKFLKEKEIIQKEKEETIQLIEDNTINRIKENNNKYESLLSYLDSIKNDKQKLIEYFRVVTHF